MGKTCGIILGILILLAGLELFFNASFAGMTGHQIAGLLLVLFGLGKLAHAAGMCGSCESCKK